MIKTVDLFSGCGGLSLGFERAGFQVIAAYDNWEPAVKVYRDNFSHPIYTDDLSDENVQNKIAEMHPDVIIGGPPCQDYSSAGHRDITLGRAALTLSYRDIIIKARPKYFLMENVPEIRKYRILADIIQDFKNAGYGLTQRILEASYYGVPQARKRFILIGGLNEPDDFLGVAIDRRASDHAMTMRDYFGDSLDVDYYFRVPRSYSRRGIFSIDEPCQTIRGVDRPIPPGYPGHPSDPVPLGPNVRALTVKERSMVQTFPETFKFSGNKTDQNQMIGNAVPVNLAKAVADALYEHIVNKNGPSLKGVDLFAGCGGMTLGFEKAGVDILAGYDNWKPACDIYSANFSHGVQDIPDGKLLITLHDPTILYWHDSENLFPDMKVSYTGVPIPQVLYSENIDMLDSTILGIEKVTADCSDEVLFAVSFDDGASWWSCINAVWAKLSEEKSGMSKIALEAISVDSWAEKATTGQLKYRFIISGADGFVRSITTDYLNTEE